MDHCIIKDKKLVSLIYVPAKSSSDNIFAPGIDIIGKEACAHNTSLTTIKLPDGVKKIEAGAFYACKNLQEVYLPDSCTVIEDGSFADCSNLKFIHYGPHARFGSQCFSGCAKLKWIEQGNIKARTFYFPRHNSFAITIFQPRLSNNDYNIYAGRFSDAGFPTSQPDMKAPLLYFAEISEKYVWYDPNVQYAIDGVNYQKSNLSLSSYYKKHYSLDTLISSHEFFSILGICYEGQNLWNFLSKKYGYNETDSISIKDIADIIQPLSEKLYSRLFYVLDHQNEHINLFDLNNGFSWRDFNSIEKNKL